jgi:uncharacterized protein (TIGR01777 family)
MNTILITGGTGLIGKSLTGLLVSKGHRVIILSRKKRQPEGNISYVEWDPGNSVIDPAAISEAEHIIHLAGAGVADKRWTDKRKKQIADSRVKGGELIVKALKEIPNNIQTIVSASAIGWYGPDVKGSNHAFVETDAAAGDFLGNTSQLWERSIQPVTELGKRLVILRTGIVLSNEGGAYPEFKMPLKGGVAGILGSGKQVISWIHIDDICRIYLAAIENKNMNGVYNATAPETITNKEFILRLAKVRKRPFIPVHVPEFALKLFLGEMSVEVLKSTTVDDSRLRNSGFNFLFPSVDAALGELEGGRRQRAEGRRQRAEIIK